MQPEFTFYMILMMTGYKLMLAIIALPFARLTLRWFDNFFPSTKFTWLEKADDHAKAIYYGARFLAICVLFGFAIS